MYRQPEVGDGVKVDTSLKAILFKLKARSPDFIGSTETVKKVPASLSKGKTLYISQSSIFNKLSTSLCL